MKTGLSIVMGRRFGLTAVITLAILLFITSAALADAASVNFDSYTLGSINGQDGWSMTGAFDVEVVANTYGYATFGTQSLRISNAVTSGAFGNQTFSKPLTDEAGETSAENGGISGGVRQPYFEASWDFASTVPSSEQVGLQIVASPDRGDGARMSWLSMADTPTGLTISFFDFEHQSPVDCSYPGPSWRFTDLVTGLDRTVPHNIKITMRFVDGIANDVVNIYVDGVLVHTGLSWEDYFRDCESNPTRTVDSVLFRVAGTAVPATSGNGFLIDNFTIYSGPANETFVEVSPAASNGWGLLEETATGAGSFVAGPASPPAGLGSVQLDIDSSGGIFVGAGNYGGINLHDINRMTYNTYRQSGDATLGIALQFNVDYDLTDADNSWQGRLVYEPYQSGTNPADATWELWDAMDANARWWATGGDGVALCPHDFPCSWGDFLAAFPNAGIHATIPGVLFKAGGGWAGGFVGNIDDFTIQINGDTTHYNFENSPCRNLNQTTNYNTIQDAIDNANPNDVIQCDAGTYSENITIDTPVTLRGAGSDCSDSTANSIIQQAANTPVVTLAASGTAVSPLLLQDLCIQPQEVFGIDVPNSSGTVSYVTLDNVSVQGTNPETSENERGLVVGTTATLSNLIVTDSAFDHLAYGWYFHKEVSADSSTVSSVTVTNSSFSHNDVKGIYAEKLSDATFTGGVVDGNGTFTAFWNADWNGGFDINLKAGAYQNLTFDGMTFSNNGLNTRHGVALMVKGRDDGGTYGAFPATVDNVLIQNNSITGNERGIRFGEVGRSNASPTTVTVMRNVINNNAPTYGGGDGSAAGAVIQFSVGDVTVKGNTVSGNPQVFSQNTVGSALTAYANNITTFTDAGLTSAAGAVNGRHNWWGTHAVQPAGVDNDSWAFLLGAAVGTWADGTGTVTLADSIAADDASFVGNGRLVIVNHGSGLGNVPFGKGIPADTGASQCADFYDFFAIGGSGTYNVSIPVEGTTCTSGTIDDNLFEFALNGSGQPDTACAPDSACWNSVAATRGGDVLTATVAAADLQGTPFAVPSVNNNDPTAVSLSSFSTTAIPTRWPYAGLLLLSFITGIVYWRQKQSRGSV